MVPVALLVPTLNVWRAMLSRFASNDRHSTVVMSCKSVILYFFPFFCCNTAENTILCESNAQNWSLLCKTSQKTSI